MLPMSAQFRGGPVITQRPMSSGGPLSMPYKSEKQKRLMQAVAHNPQFASKVGIPQSVGKKFEAHKNEHKSKALRKRGGY